MNEPTATEVLANAQEELNQPAAVGASSPGWPSDLTDLSDTSEMATSIELATVRSAIAAFHAKYLPTNPLVSAELVLSEEAIASSRLSKTNIAFGKTNSIHLVMDATRNAKSLQEKRAKGRSNKAEVIRKREGNAPHMRDLEWVTAAIAVAIRRMEVLVDAHEYCDCIFCASSDLNIIETLHALRVTSDSMLFCVRNDVDNELYLEGKIQSTRPQASDVLPSRRTADQDGEIIDNSPEVVSLIKAAKVVLEKLPGNLDRETAGVSILEDYGHSWNAPLA